MAIGDVLAMGISLFEFIVVGIGHGCILESLGHMATTQPITNVFMPQSLMF